MNVYVKSLCCLMLGIAVVAGQAQDSSKKIPKKPAESSLQAQIDKLRSEMEARIQKLEQQLADRDVKVQQADAAAAEAQGKAAQAQQAAATAQQTLTESSKKTATSLDAEVATLRSETASSVAVVQEKQKKLEAAFESPVALHYKGITLTPGGFIAATTVFRNHATGGGTATSFTVIPFDGQSQAKISEFAGDGRASRVSLLTEGKLSKTTLRGYYEADFLGVGIASNNNQTNSYVLRQRALWAQAEMQHGWTVTGGQMWSLSAEEKKGLSAYSADIAIPMTSDPSYVAGFIYARQYGFRVTKKFNDSVFAAVSIENPQVGSVAGRGFPTNFLDGSAGAGGGFYNSTANYCFNKAPDVLAKIAFDPGWGHYEIYGIARFFRNRIYPNYAASTTAAQSAGAYNESTVGGAIGGSFRVPTFKKKLDLGMKAQWGDGAGRYGGSSLPDMTADPYGNMALLHSFSGIATMEFHATHRLDFYGNYGGDYVGRRAFVSAAGKPVGYGSPLFDNSGCSIEPLPGAGGYLPGSLSTCAGDVRDIQEVAVGSWFDYYKGPKGRLRQGLQYSDILRQTWSGIGGAPKGDDKMFFTSFMYYLP